MNLPNLMTPNTTPDYKGTILVVDDESSIRKALNGALSDEGYTVTEAANGQDALTYITNNRVNCVLLDIWMPGLDGLETLSKIKELDPKLAVIMISGHATIATAVKATRMGASNFIEKPLDLDAILIAVDHALSKDSKASIFGNNESKDSIEDTSDFSTTIDDSVKERLNTVAFVKTVMDGDTVNQKTLAKSCILYGIGLHSGKKSGLVLEPLPKDSGIHFVGVSERTVVPAHVSFVESTGWATTLKSGDTQVATIEHLMSALHAYGISNLLIKCNGEVPVLDGSSRDYCALFDSVGTIDQNSNNWKELVIRKPISYRKSENEFIEFLPADEFSIDYTLIYPAPINTQEFSFTLSSVEDYKEQISLARTFGFVKDITFLQQKGLALGGRFDNFVLIGDNGTINSQFRYKDEPVRHKILDAIGDLYLLGRKIRGRVAAKMTGHSDNVELCRKVLHEAMSN